MSKLTDYAGFVTDWGPGAHFIRTGEKSLRHSAGTSSAASAFNAGAGFRFLI